MWSDFYSFKMISFFKLNNFLLFFKWIEIRPHNSGNLLVKLY